MLHEGLHQPNTADGTKTLCYHVEHGANERHLAGQEQAKSHRRVDVSTCVVLCTCVNDKKNEREAKRWVKLPEMPAVQ